MEQDPRAAADLDRVVDDLLRALGGKALRHRGRNRQPFGALCLLPRGAVDEQTRGLEERRHTAERLPHHGHVGQPLAELLSLARVGDGFVQRARGHPACGGSNGRAEEVEGAHAELEALIERTEQR
jgi:hypothetical protein